MEVHALEVQYQQNGLGCKRKALSNGDHPPAKKADVSAERWDKAEIMRVREKHVG